MSFLEKYAVTRKSALGLAVLPVVFLVGTLTGTNVAAAFQKKSAPAKATAPAKAAAPAAKAAPSSGAKASSPGGSAKTATGSGSGREASKSSSSNVKPAVGSVKTNSNGTKTVQAKNGEVTKSASGKVQSFKSTDGKKEVKFAPNGKVKEVHAEAKGGGKLTVSHAPGGARRTVIERPDHSRLVAEGHGHGYIEHRYEYGGHNYYARSYYYNGGYYQSYYHPYYYGGVQLYGYAPAYYYPTAYYGWAYNPWPAPAPYAWGWGGSPWYGYYGAYFQPYPVYPSPAFWLTDYLIAASLTAAYEAAAADNAGVYPTGNPVADSQANLLLASYTPAGNHGPSDGWNSGDPWAWADAGAGVTLSPEIKKEISNEIQADLAVQKAQKAAGGDSSAAGNLATLLADGKPHIFVAGSSITATSAGQDCSITDGDVLTLPSAPSKDAESANLTVLATKKTDCAATSTVAVQLADVQEMYNHLLGSVDKGLGEMKDKGAKGGLPAPPADVTAGSKEAPYAAAAPAADKDGAAELDAASKEGAQTEAQVVAEANTSDDTGTETASAGTAPGNAVAPAPDPSKTQTITVGQTIAQVVAMKGKPNKVFNFSATKVVYVYADLKITFINGRLTDAE